MTGKLLSSLLLAGILSLAVAGCDKNDGDGAGRADQFAPIASVTGPATGRVGQPVTLTVSLRGPSSCGQNGEAGAGIGKVTAVINHMHITLTGALQYMGDVCTMDIAWYPTAYTFTPVYEGTYTISYIDDHQQAKTFTVVVQ